MSKRYAGFPANRVILLAGLLSLVSCGRATDYSGMPPEFGGDSSTFHLPPDQWKFRDGAEGKIPRPYQPGPRLGTEEVAKFREIRVKIFPHNSTYAEPLGRERARDRVRFSSKAKCSTYSAKGESAEGGMDRSQVLKNGSEFSFTTESLSRPVWLACSGPVQLLREGAKKGPFRYAGNFFVKKVAPAKGTPYLTVVNVLPFEQYLKGVVPSEMPASWPKEALKAQAVAARTYALYELTSEGGLGDSLLEKEGAGAQIDDTIGYQAYAGIQKAAATDQAVEDTAGEVITYQGNLVKAFFHSDSGGHTEDAGNVWGTSMPFAVGKPEIYPAKLAVRSGWETKAKLKVVQSSFQGRGALSASSELTGFAVAPADSLLSGRAKAITLETKGGGVKVPGTQFSHVLHLRSSLLRFELPQNGEVKISGKGFGHGVGMSQWGARVMAEHFHKPYKEILGFYYTGVKVESAP
jgi:stage II sporulation protein D